MVINFFKYVEATRENMTWALQIWHLDTDKPEGWNNCMCFLKLSEVMATVLLESMIVYQMWLIRDTDQKEDLQLYQMD
jgi:hypothetical protein